MTEQFGTSQGCLAIDDQVDLDTLLEHLDHLEGDPKLWPRTLANLLAVIENQLERSQPSHKGDCGKMARDITAAIAHYLGGRQVYLPRDARLQRALRDHQIYKAHRGNNHQALADQHGLTVIQIYNIVAKQEKLFRASQPQFPF